MNKLFVLILSPSSQKNRHQHFSRCQPVAAVVNASPPPSGDPDQIAKAEGRVTSRGRQQIPRRFRCHHQIYYKFFDIGIKLLQAQKSSG